MELEDFSHHGNEIFTIRMEHEVPRPAIQVQFREVRLMAYEQERPIILGYSEYRYAEQSAVVFRQIGHRQQITGARGQTECEGQRARAGGQTECDGQRTRAGGQTECDGQRTRAGGQTECDGQITRTGGQTECDGQRSRAGGQTECDGQITRTGGQTECDGQRSRAGGQTDRQIEQEGQEECEVCCTLIKKKQWILGLVVAGIIVIIVGVPLGVLHRQRQKSSAQEFSAQFINGCQKFMGGNHKSYCQHIFAVFEQAYVGRPACNVPVEAYDPLMAEVPFRHPCNKTLLWSGTEDLVHDYTQKNKDCFTLEDTLLGHILDEKIWCGRKGSNETFTTDCPEHNDCENNSVSSFWNRASAAFAEHACGEVTVMLNGSKEEPFDPKSTLAKKEIKALKHPEVKHLNVILITGHKSDCTTQSLQDLRGKLDPNISYNCREVMKSQTEECTPSTNAGCGTCLSMVLK